MRTKHLHPPSTQSAHSAKPEKTDKATERAKAFESKLHQALAAPTTSGCPASAANPALPPVVNAAARRLSASSTPQSKVSAQGTCGASSNGATSSPSSTASSGASGSGTSGSSTSDSSTSGSGTSGTQDASGASASTSAPTGDGTQAVTSDFESQELQFLVTNLSEINHDVGRSAPQIEQE